MILLKNFYVYRAPKKRIAGNRVILSSRKVEGTNVLSIKLFKVEQEQFFLRGFFLIILIYIIVFCDLCLTISPPLPLKWNI